MAGTESGGAEKPSDLTGQAVGDTERLARQIFYDTSFEEGVVSANALLQFRGNSNPDGSFDESLFALSLVEAPAVHEAGCAAAVVQNARRRQRRVEKGLEPPDPVPGQDRRYYCGFTEAVCKELRISGDNYNVELVHQPEQEMEAHVAIFLRPKSGKLHVNDRTEAGRLLALRFANPTAHVCECDGQDEHHPVAKHGSEVLVLQAA